MSHRTAMSLSPRILCPLVSILAISLGGCRRAPSLSIAGSFFPVWMFCFVLGIIVATVARVLLLRTGLDQDIKPAVLIYPCIAASCSLTIWLIFFG